MPQATRDIPLEAVRSLARVARIIERASGDLGMAQYRVLSAIAAGEDRASRVARRLELGRPTVSAAVDALCRGQLLERRSCEGDHRATDLRITDAGWEKLGAVESRMVRALEELCSRAPSGVVAALAALGAAIDQARL